MKQPNLFPRRLVYPDTPANRERLSVTCPRCNRLNEPAVNMRERIGALPALLKPNYCGYCRFPLWALEQNAALN